MVQVADSGYFADVGVCGSGKTQKRGWQTMIPNTEITISENKILVTSMIYVSAKDEFDKAKIIIHNHYPNAQKGYEDNYKVFVEV